MSDAFVGLLLIRKCMFQTEKKSFRFVAFNHDGGREAFEQEVAF
jgi:hypothetical protein